MLRIVAFISFFFPSALAGQCNEIESQLWLNIDSFTEVMQSCAVIASGSAAGTTDCIKSTIVGLSSGCASCFGQTVECGKRNCMDECMASCASQFCLDCTKKSGCDSALNVCTGFNQGPPKPKAGRTDGNAAGSISAVLALALPFVLITLSFL